MMKKFTLILIIPLLTGCLRLDNNLFNSEELTVYLKDDYAGEVDFRLDAAYDIDLSLVDEFTIESKSKDESDSTKIYAIYIGNKAEIKTDTIIMYCHGNRDHMDFYWQRAKLLANTGSKNRFGVLMIDYRGFGRSEGKSSEKGMYADVDAALKWLKSQGLTDDRLVIYGFSLGSAPATKMSVDNFSMKPSKLMLEAPYASAELMVQDASKLAIPGKFFTDLEINNGEEIKRVRQPLFWIHGEQDNFIGIDTQGEVIFNNYNGNYKEAHRIPNADHGDIQPQMGYSNYLSIVESFIVNH